LYKTTVARVAAQRIAQSVTQVSVAEHQAAHKKADLLRDKVDWQMAVPASFPWLPNRAAQ
jgi:hypothetical protein